MSDATPLAALKILRKAALERAQAALTQALAQLAQAQRTLHDARSSLRRHLAHPPKTPEGRLSGVQARRAQQRALDHRDQTLERTRALASARQAAAERAAEVERARAGLERAHGEARLLDRADDQRRRDARRQAALREQAWDEDGRLADP